MLQPRLKNQILKKAENASASSKKSDFTRKIKE